MKIIDRSPLPLSLPLALIRAWNRLPLRIKIFLSLAAIVLLAVLLSLIRSKAGLAAPRLVFNSPGDPPAIGARGPVTLEFEEPMLPDSVESRLSFDPPMEGHFTWDNANNRTVSFWPARSLQPGQRYSIRLAALARSKNGRELRQASTWQVEVRQPELLYLSPSHAPELWKVSSSGQNRTRLTNTGGKIVDFSVSFDGNHIAYSVMNESQGIDLWEMDRLGASTHLLLPCGADWCISPAYAPDGKQIVYSRRKVSGIANRQPEIPRIWTLDRAAQTTAELFADPGIGGTRAVWSPDGRFLAFYDEVSGGLRIYNVQAQSSFLLPAVEGTGTEWSPDSTSLLYLQAGLSGELPYSWIDQVNVETRQVQRVLGDDSNPEDYSVPAWSPDGEWAAVGQRLAGGSLTRQLWLVRLGNGQNAIEGQPITDDVLFTHGGYQWEPGGSRLVYQRLAYGESDSLPQVAVWNRLDRQTLLLAEDSFQPFWQP